MKDTNPWFDGTYDNIDFRKELVDLGIIEDINYDNMERKSH